MSSDLLYHKTSDLNQIPNNILLATQSYQAKIQQAFGHEKETRAVMLKNNIDQFYKKSNPLHNGMVNFEYDSNQIKLNEDAFLKEGKIAGEVMNSSGALNTVTTNQFIDPNVVEALKIQSSFEDIVRVETGKGQYLPEQKLFRMISDDFGNEGLAKFRVEAGNEGKTGSQLGWQSDSFTTKRNYCWWQVESTFLQQQEVAAQSQYYGAFAPLNSYQEHSNKVARTLVQLNRHLNFDVFLGNKQDGNVGSILIPVTAFGDSPILNTTEITYDLDDTVNLPDAAYQALISKIITMYSQQHNLEAYYMANVISMSDQVLQNLQTTQMNALTGSNGSIQVMSRYDYLVKTFNAVLSNRGESLTIKGDPTLRAGFMNPRTSFGAKNAYIFTRKETNDFLQDGLVFDYPIPLGVYVNNPVGVGLKKVDSILAQIGQVYIKRGKLHQVYITA
jgi:hypothetical protein